MKSSKILFSSLLLIALLLHQSYGRQTELQKFYVTEKDEKCLLLDIAAKIQINDRGKIKTLPIIPSASVIDPVRGSCNDTTFRTSNIEVMMQNGSINFAFSNNEADTFVEYIELKLGSRESYKLQMNFRISTTNEAYQCGRTRYLALSPNITLVVDEVKVQAFNVKNASFSAEVEHCTPLSTTIQTTSISPTNGTTLKPTTHTIYPTHVTTVTTMQPTTHNTTNATTETTMQPTTHNTTNATTETTMQPTTHNTTHVTTVSTIQSTTHSTTNVTSKTTTYPPPSTTIHSSTITTNTPPSIPKYEVVGKNGVICTVVQFKGSIDISYNTVDKNTQTKTFPLKHITASGSCSSTVNTIHFTWKPAGATRNFELIFSLKTLAANRFSRSLLEISKSYSLSSIKLDYLVEEAVFPKSDSVGQQKTVTSQDNNRLKTNVGETYRCNSDDTFQLNKDTHLHTSDLKIDAFRSSKNDKFSDKELVCKADKPSGGLTPGQIAAIVLGVLLGIGLIILIIYLLYRRSKRHQYERI